MNLNENEKRMVYQIESTCQVAVLNEIAMTHRYTRNQTTKDTAESLLSKLHLLSDKECMDFVRDVQKNYRLPDKARTHHFGKATTAFAWTGTNVLTVNCISL